MKDKVLEVINDNSVPKHFCEYGEGVFADSNAVDSMAEEVVELFSTHMSQYAEFCVRCDREGLPLMKLDDYIKQYF